MEEFGHTQENLAKVVGKSRSHVANTMRLLSLPAPIKRMVEEGQLTAGHARALLTAPDAVQLAEEVVKKGLSVRETEQLAQTARPQGKRPAASTAPQKDADTRKLERDLTAILGLKVTISLTGAGAGALTIHYSTLDQLDDVLHRLNRM
jgi:ParB family chromosome partitioning protein